MDNEINKAMNIEQDPLKDYKEIKINKMLINGKEQEGNVISAEDTADKQELNITVYTQSKESIEKKDRRHSRIYELFQKGLFHGKRG